MRRPQRLVSLFLILLIAAPVHAEVSERLEVGAQRDGAYGVLSALEDLLVESPDLAASPDQADGLLALVLETLERTPDAEEDHARAAGVLVVAFAPPARRDEVAAVVAAAMSEFGEPDEARVDDEPVLRFGDFRVFPGLATGLRYDDNLFATERGEVDDLALVVAPSLGIGSEWQRHELDLEFGGELTRYQENPGEDYEDFFAGGDFRYDVSPVSNVFGGASFRRAHEERGSPDDVNGEEPTIYDQSSAYLGAARRFGRLGLRIGGTLRDLDFDDVPAFFGEINNDDRDRRLLTGGGELSWRLGPWQDRRARVFARLAADLRDYDDRRDDWGFERSSEGWRAELGTELWVGRSAVLELFAGWMHQGYDDSAFDDVDEPSFGASLEWSPIEGTWLTATVDRTLEETTLPFASSYLVTRVGASVDQELSPRTSWRIAASWLQNDYQGVGRKDDLYVVSASLRHRIFGPFTIEPGYRFVHRDSSSPGESYDRNQVFLRLAAELTAPSRWRTRAPRRHSVAEIAWDELPETDFSGFYLGAQAGIDALASPMRGPRRMGTSFLQTSFGDHGGSAGIFAGVGTLWRGLYLGLEVDGDLSDTDWDHDSRPDVRFFSIERESSYGASVRIGSRIGPAGLLYARIGAQHTRFRTRYERGVAVVDDFDSNTALRTGVGLEAGGYGRSFVRMDYSFADHDEVDADFGGGIDAFDRREAMFRAGLGYRFVSFLEPATDRSRGEAPVLDLGGFYLGVQLGHGALTTELEGPRRGGTRSLVADFGDHGFSWGGFGGWGHSIGRWYGGIELEGEASEAEWIHRRPGLDRFFTLEKRSSVGAGLRLGFQLPSASLLYGRVGAVHTRFRNFYAVEGFVVDEEDGRTGLRFGGGLEVPASEHVRIRADYSFTRYEREDLDYGLAIDEFDPEESQFRIGLVYVF